MINMNNISKKLKQTLINMKKRCYDQNTEYYKYYGGKGIIVCDEWLNDRKKFYEWALENGYEEHLTIDRKDPNGNYEPNNCRWATIKEQANNKTNTIYIEYNEEIKPLSQWSEETEINRSTIKDRFEKGKDILEDYSLIKININGEIKSLNKLSEESGILYDTIIQRYHAGWEHDQLINDLLTNETKLITIGDRIHTVTEWAEISGLTREIILMRISYGWENEDLLKPITKEGRKKKYYEINGEFHTKNEWCKISGISPMTFYRRVKNGLTGKKLIETIN